MAAARPGKRLSTPGPKSARHPRVVDTPTTPERSPIKRKKGISLRHKQTLIENLQLEITERARRLRAQYSMQAQGLRSRIEIRVNRIPTALRKMKMSDLLQKCLEQEQAKTAAISRPPPVPTKDAPTRSTQSRTATRPKTAQVPSRNQKRMSDELAGDKENEFEYAETAKKRVRANQAATSGVRPNQVLSPTSSNSRLNRDFNRPASPVKGRAGSPLKSTSAARGAAAATSMLSSMVEKAKGTRTAAQRRQAAASSASAAPTTATRGRKPAAAPASRPGTRMARRPSAASEASDGSTATNATTVVRKAAAPSSRQTTAAATKKVMSSFRKTTAATETKKTANAKATTAGAGATGGRILRKRN